MHSEAAPGAICQSAISSRIVTTWIKSSQSVRRFTTSFMAQMLGLSGTYALRHVIFEARPRRLIRLERRNCLKTWVAMAVAQLPVVAAAVH
jgi:hypothetical protein